MGVQLDDAFGEDFGGFDNFDLDQPSTTSAPVTGTATASFTNFDTNFDTSNFDTSTFDNFNTTVPATKASNPEAVNAFASDAGSTFGDDSFFTDVTPQNNALECDAFSPSLAGMNTGLHGRHGATPPPASNVIGSKSAAITSNSVAQFAGSVNGMNGMSSPGKMAMQNPSTMANAQQSPGFSQHQSAGTMKTVQQQQQNGSQQQDQQNQIQAPQIARISSSKGKGKNNKVPVNGQRLNSQPYSVPAVASAGQQGPGMMNSNNANRFDLEGGRGGDISPASKTHSKENMQGGGNCCTRRIISCRNVCLYRCGCHKLADGGKGGRGACVTIICWILSIVVLLLVNFFAFIPWLIGAEISTKNLEWNHIQKNSVKAYHHTSTVTKRAVQTGLEKLQDHLASSDSGTNGNGLVTKEQRELEEDKRAKILREKQLEKDVENETGAATLHEIEELKNRIFTLENQQKLMEGKFDERVQELENRFQNQNPMQNPNVQKMMHQVIVQQVSQQLKKTEGNNGNGKNSNNDNQNNHDAKNNLSNNFEPRLESVEQSVHKILLDLQTVENGMHNYVDNQKFHGIQLDLQKVHKQLQNIEADVEKTKKTLNNSTVVGPPLSAPASSASEVVHDNKKTPTTTTTPAPSSGLLGGLSNILTKVEDAVEDKIEKVEEEIGLKPEPETGIKTKLDKILEDEKSVEKTFGTAIDLKKHPTDGSGFMHRKTTEDHDGQQHLEGENAGHIVGDEHHEGPHVMGEDQHLGEAHYMGDGHMHRNPLGDHPHDEEPLDHGDFPETSTTKPALIHNSDTLLADPLHPTPKPMHNVVHAEVETPRDNPIEPSKLEDPHVGMGDSPRGMEHDVMMYDGGMMNGYNHGMNGGLDHGMKLGLDHGLYGSTEFPLGILDQHMDPNHDPHVGSTYVQNDPHIMGDPNESHHMMGDPHGINPNELNNVKDMLNNMMREKQGMVYDGSLGQRLMDQHMPMHEDDRGHPMNDHLMQGNLMGDHPIGGGMSNTMHQGEPPMAVTNNIVGSMQGNMPNIQQNRNMPNTQQVGNNMNTGANKMNMGNNVRGGNMNIGGPPSGNMNMGGPPAGNNMNYNPAISSMQYNPQINQQMNRGVPAMNSQQMNRGGQQPMYRQR